MFTIPENLKISEYYMIKNKIFEALIRNNFYTLQKTKLIEKLEISHNDLVNSEIGVVAKASNISQYYF